MPSLQLITDATVEPVSLQRAKDHLRVDSDDEDELIVFLITAARTHVERKTGRALISQQWCLSLDYFPNADYRLYSRSFRDGYVCPSILLPKPRLISVDSITYQDELLGITTLDSSKYVVDQNSEPARIYPARNSYWPYPGSLLPSNVQVKFTAGYGLSPADVPAPYVLAILLLVAHWYQNREASALGNLTSVPMGVDALLSNYTFTSFAFGG